VIEVFHADTPNVFKVTIALEEMGLPYKKTAIDLPSQQQKSPEFLKVNPNGRVPAIIDDQPVGGGAPIAIFESGTILQYLAEKTGRFIPADVRGRYDVLQWVQWQMAGFGPMLGQAHHFVCFAPEPVPYAAERYRAEAARLYGVLDRRLEGRDYICGEVSIADMACFPWVLYREYHQQNLDDFPNVKRWFSTVEARPAVGRILETAFVPTLVQLKAMSAKRRADRQAQAQQQQ
jgi:GST-like protein